MPQNSPDQGPDAIEEAVDIVVSLLCKFHAWSMRHWEKHVNEHETFDTPQCFREENQTIDRFLARAVSSQTLDPDLALAAARTVKAQLLEAIEKRTSKALRVIGDRWDPPKSTKLTLYLALREALRPGRTDRKVSSQEQSGTVRSLWLGSAIAVDSSKAVHPRIPGSQCALWRRHRAQSKSSGNQEFGSCSEECEVLFFFEERFNVKELAKYLDIPVPTLHRYKHDCKELELNAKARVKADSKSA